MSAESLSVNLEISGESFAPREVLSQLLAAIVQALGPGFLGHVKGIARFPDGILYASTVGLPPDVNFHSVGQVPSTLAEMDFELTCIAINLDRQRLRGAVDAAIAAAADQQLIRGNFHDRSFQH